MYVCIYIYIYIYMCTVLCSISVMYFKVTLCFSFSYFFCYWFEYVAIYQDWPDLLNIITTYEYCQKPRSHKGAWIALRGCLNVFPAADSIMFNPFIKGAKSPPTSKSDFSKQLHVAHESHFCCVSLCAVEPKFPV
jgi:hypothetical protein